MYERNFVSFTTVLCAVVRAYVIIMALHLTNTISTDRLTHFTSNDLDMFVDSGRHLGQVVILVGLFSLLWQRDPDDTTTVLLPCHSQSV